MSLSFTPPQGGNALDGETYRGLETAVREVLGDADEVLSVRFSRWVAEDGRSQLVCKVETPPADAFSDEEQWRWWSPLFETPDELTRALREAVAYRQRTAVVRPGRPAATGSRPSA